MPAERSLKIDVPTEAEDRVPALRGAKLGGAPFNFAYRANTLGDRGVIVSRLGRDDLGRRAYDAMVALGLDTAHVQWDEEHPTGTVPVVVDE